MDQGPLVKEQIDAGAKLVREFAASYKPLQAAFWLKNEEGQWYLYLASDQIDDSNFDIAYTEVIRILRSEKSPWLDPFEVKVTGIDRPLAKAVLDLQNSYPVKPATRLRNCMLGGVSVNEAYIYAVPIAASS